MTPIISGALIAGYLTVALFFLRFWRDSRDRLFAIFASAFVLLAVQRLALSLSDALLENTTLFFVLRLVAFALILFAIVDKNRR